MVITQRRRGVKGRRGRENRKQTQRERERNKEKHREGKQRGEGGSRREVRGLLALVGAQSRQPGKGGAGRAETHWGWLGGDRVCSRESSQSIQHLVHL